MAISDSDILQIISRQPKHAASYKQLLHELGLHGNERRELAIHLRRLVNRGDLRESQPDLFAIPAKEKPRGKNLVAGRVRMHPDGYGFVIPDDAALKQRLDGDIFINPHAVGAAMNGDRVLVELGAINARRRAEGRIVSIIGREHATVVGVFHYGSRNNYVTPIDEKITQEIVIPHGMERPHLPKAADAEHQKHRVIGKEARRREPWEDLDGIVVDVEITRWPTPTQNPRGRVVEILGYEDDFGVDVEIIIRKYHLPHRFPENVIEAAQDAPNFIAAHELEGRRDFRSQPIVTIDGETARDFDDAVTAHRLSNGNYQLQVHIADVAHYVTDGSALDEEARLRGTSVYFPDRAVPMLPIELSTDICSLRPQVDRLVMSCIMEIDHQGEVVSYELVPGVIRSAERMTYTDVNLILEGDALLRKKYAPLVPAFELMKELALVLNRKRVRRGSIDFDLPEPVIEFDEQGLMQGVSRSERNIAHRLIEEFMLAANECVAGFLEQKAAPSLYRIHEKPEARKVYEFETIAASFGYSLGVGALPIRRMQLKSDRRMRHHSGRNPRDIEIPQKVHITPRMYQKLTQKIAGKPEERILSYLMLRSLKQARYSEQNEGHFALAAPTYTHFTSPIRRYPDLIVHRVLKHVLARGSDRKHAQEAPISEDELREIAESSSYAERRADEAERELMDWKKMKFMQQHLGSDFAGLVVSVTKYGLFVELEEMFIEGLVPLACLNDDRYTYRENTKQIIGERSKKTYSLGDRVRVIVDRIDRMQRKIQFAIYEEKPSRAQRTHRHR
jgi:ribonuclease R